MEKVLFLELSQLRGVYPILEMNSRVFDVDVITEVGRVC